MKTSSLLLGIIWLISYNAIGQIVTSSSSLPDAGDILEYKTLETITPNYMNSGDNIEWDFTGMTGDVIMQEEYFDASTGENFDQFPETDMIFNFSGADVYANRNTTNIELVGTSGGQLVGGVNIEEAQSFSEPYVIRRAPLGYGDTYSGATSFSFTLAAESLGPLVNVFDAVNPIEGSTLDSIKIGFNLTRSEEVDAYGTVLIGDQSIDALRLVQQDQSVANVEVYLVTDIISTWVNVSEFLDPETLGLQEQSVTSVKLSLL